jgi:TonB family protein
MLLQITTRLLVLALLASTQFQTAVNSGVSQGTDATSQSKSSVPQNPKPGPTVELLTKAEEKDLKRYIQAVYSSVIQQWYADMPESIMLGEPGRNVLKFRILQDGTVPKDYSVMELSSERKNLDEASMRAILKASPFKHLPEQFSKPFIELRFSFYYNSKPQKSQ